ncbi:hypothetical protein E2C01_020729 [Portunus trituberculatus]|uniref:Uncharacterized protein n=1 Tax=Portunus trituberculatus TaxID=210409 RepID=A0A5B7E342_PORTR|nr:hypothetical protein [Portunus trituberculatus]
MLRLAPQGCYGRLMLWIEDHANVLMGIGIGSSPRPGVSLIACRGADERVVPASRRAPRHSTTILTPSLPLLDRHQAR